MVFAEGKISLKAFRHKESKLLSPLVMMGGEIDVEKNLDYEQSRSAI